MYAVTYIYGLQALTFLHCMTGFQNPLGANYLFFLLLCVTISQTPGTLRLQLNSPSSIHLLSPLPQPFLRVRVGLLDTTAGYGEQNHGRL
jgi:hypothetical protein